ncbi:MAG: glycogen synthase [Candidatus Aminicenantes bacterium]|nr:MAG: glycogen synthase [Candidatus Aminicenantes bacterium]
MEKNLRVVFVSAEVSPYAKLGEMADVSYSLPKHLSSLGMKVSLFMPKYRRPEIDSLPMERITSNLSVNLGDRTAKASVFRGEQGKYDVYFIDNPKYFWRDQIYGTGTREYLDNDERFIFFNRAVLEFLHKHKLKTDVIHCNNWPTALIPVFLKTQYTKKKHFHNTATLLTLHNIAYQGEYPPDSLMLTGLNLKYFTSHHLSLNGKFNFLKAGIMYADVLNTVSSTYRREILTKKHGLGLEEILRGRKDFFYSIRNGIDYEVWNPETDPYIATNYSFSDLGGKKACKQDLIKEFGLPIHSKTPVTGIVSYMRTHKGFDILLEAMPELIKLDMALVILGQGEEQYENQLIEIQRKYPDKVAVRLEMNPALTHKIAAGADIFLIPSLYEPCGLNQLYSFRYATVPVVRGTGGLEETVRPFRPTTSEGNGFVFKEYTSAAMLAALKEALKYFRKPALWKKILSEGMKENFSWDNAARRYMNLYKNALDIKSGGKSGRL